MKNKTFYTFTIIILSILFNCQLFAQGTNWRLQGNANVSSTSGQNKIGSLNNEEIEIITNNTTRIKIQKEGDVLILIVQLH